MTCIKQNHVRMDNNTTCMTLARTAVEVGFGRSGPPRYGDNPACPDDQPAILQALVSGLHNDVLQQQYLHGIAITSRQLGNRAFMRWVGTLRAAGQGGQAHAAAGQDRQDPARSPAGGAPLQFMPKKRSKKKEPAAVTPEAQAGATAGTGMPELPGAASETAPGPVTQTVPEAALTQAQAEANKTAAAGQKKKKKSRVQVALNTLRAEGVEAFKDYLEAGIGETVLLHTLVERVQRAQDLGAVRGAALGAIAARMGELDPEAAPMHPQTLATVRGQVVERPVVAPARTSVNIREKELIDCCNGGNAGKLRLLIKNRKFDVNLAVFHCTLLFLAAFRGHTAVVRELLSVPGIDINLAQDKGATPLFIAAQCGHVEIVRLLMEMRGINPALGTIKEGTTPLTVAALKGCTEVVKLLLSFRNVNVDIRQYDGATPLFAAVQGNAPEVAGLLVSQGADANLPLHDSTTPLCRAAYQGSTEVVKHLLQAPGIQVDRQTVETFTALSYAVRHGHSAVVEALLNHGSEPNIADDTGVAPLHIACLCGYSEIAEMLLNAGADVNKPIQKVYSPYRIASIGGHRAIMDLLQSRMAQSMEQAAHAAGLSSRLLLEQEGRQAPEDRPGLATPSGTPSLSITQPADTPAGSAEAAGQTTEVAGGDVPAGGTGPADLSRSVRTPGAPPGAMAGSRPQVAVSQSPLEQAKIEFTQGILMRLRNDWLDPLDGIRLLEAVNTVADLDGLSALHNRVAGIERKKLRSGRRLLRRPVSGAAAGIPLPDAGHAVFSLGGKRQLDADAVEDEIRQHLEQPYHRFISQAVNDMEFGRGKPTTGYPGLLHVSAGIAGVGSCSVFYYVETEQNLIRIVGAGHHLDRETYRLDFATAELRDRRTLRLS